MSYLNNMDILLLFQDVLLINNYKKKSLFLYYEYNNKKFIIFQTFDKN